MINKSPSTGVIFSESTQSLLDAVVQSPLGQKLRSALDGEAEIFLVGGVLREALRGISETDIDLASNLSPDELRPLLEQAGVRVVDTGVSHGTVLALYQGQSAEITTFRKPGKRERTEYSKDIITDLSGRDFTINAMALNFFSGEFHDPFSGKEDLEAGILRAVGVAKERFVEDPLRVLRAVRFGPAAGRTLAPELEQEIKTFAKELTGVSIERVRLELEKILLGSFADRGLSALAVYGLLPYTLPELEPAIGFEQNEFHDEDVFQHTLTVVARAPRELPLRLAALFHDLGKPHTLSVDEQGRRHFYQHEYVSERLCNQAMERLRFSHQLRRQVCRLVRLHMRPLTCGPTGVRRLMRDLEEDFELWRRLKVADKTPTMEDNELQDQLEQFDNLRQKEEERLQGGPVAQLAISGHDLMQELGLPEGKRIGEILSQLGEEILEDPEKNSREILLERAKRYLS